MKHYEVQRQEAFDLDNGPNERWIVYCDHGYLMGFWTKREAETYRSFVYDVWRRLERNAMTPTEAAAWIDELCEDCARGVREEHGV